MTKFIDFDIKYYSEYACYRIVLLQTIQTLELKKKLKQLRNIDRIYL